MSESPKDTEVFLIRQGSGQLWPARSAEDTTTPPKGVPPNSVCYILFGVKKEPLWRPQQESVSLEILKKLVKSSSGPLKVALQDAIDWAEDDGIEGDGDTYEVEKILATRIEGKKTWWKIKWAGYPMEEATWEPDSNVPAYLKNHFRREQALKQGHDKSNSSDETVKSRAVQPQEKSEKNGSSRSESSDDAPAPSARPTVLTIPSHSSKRRKIEESSDGDEQGNLPSAPSEPSSGVESISSGGKDDVDAKNGDDGESTEGAATRRSLRSRKKRSLPQTQLSFTKKPNGSTAPQGCQRPARSAATRASANLRKFATDGYEDASQDNNTSQGTGGSADYVDGGEVDADEDDVQEISEYDDEEDNDRYAPISSSRKRRKLREPKDRRASQRTTKSINYAETADEEYLDKLADEAYEENMRRKQERQAKWQLNTCAKCSRKITTDEQAQCRACGDVFHIGCASKASVVPPSSEDWVCKPCQWKIACDICEQLEFSKEKRFKTMIRCRTCEASYHRACLKDVFPDSNIPDGAGLAKCPDCERENGKTVELIQFMKPSTEHDKDTREFYCKFKELSNLHNLWLPERRLKRIAEAKLTNFLARYEEKDAEDIAQDEEKYAEWEKVERIVTEKTENGKNYYLVKWQDLEYCESTWEEAKLLSGYKQQIDNFNERVKWRRMVASKKEKALSPDSFKELDKEPAYLPHRLYPYQLRGLNWLRECWYKNINNILADEMGLGKTVQAIALALSLRAECEAVSRPFLVVVPLSVVSNWMREFQQWAPHFNVVAYTGNEASRKMIREYELYMPKSTKPKFDVIITTYELVHKETAALRQFEWELLIVDEGHRLKNSDSKLFIALTRQWKARHRLILTGTPLQNDLGELFNLLVFVEPTKYDYETLQAQYANVNEKEIVEKLHELLRPHILRRMKSEVLRDLIPDKVSLVVPVSATAFQKTLYKQVVNKNFEYLTQTGGKAGKKALLNILMQLRKVCNHPYLFDGVEPETRESQEEAKLLVEASGKMILLDKMLPKLQAGGHRVLIFSQMTRVLDILEDYLRMKGFSHVRLDGKTGIADRKLAIDRFNRNPDSYFVFLLSTRAGGLGINLATADTVILFDSDFNPHNDLQALSRAHRIGQSKKVMVFQFVMRNTVEESILESAKRKLLLEHVVVKKMQKGVEEAELASVLRRGAAKLFEEKESEFLAYDDAAVDKLLERSQVESKTKDGDSVAADDVDGSFTVARVFNSGDGTSNAASTDLARQGSETDAFWEKLLAERHHQWKKEQEAQLGRGKRLRKRVNYTEQDKDDILDQKKGDIEFKAEEVSSESSGNVDHDDDDDEFEGGPRGSKKLPTPRAADDIPPVTMQAHSTAPQQDGEMPMTMYSFSTGHAEPERTGGDHRTAAGAATASAHTTIQSRKKVHELLQGRRASKQAAALHDGSGAESPGVSKLLAAALQVPRQSTQSPSAPGSPSPSSNGGTVHYQPLQTNSLMHQQQQYHASYGYPGHQQQVSPSSRQTPAAPLYPGPQYVHYGAYSHTQPLQHHQRHLNHAQLLQHKLTHQQQQQHHHQQQQQHHLSRVGSHPAAAAAAPRPLAQLHPGQRPAPVLIVLDDDNDDTPPAATMKTSQHLPAAPDIVVGFAASPPSLSPAEATQAEKAAQLRRKLLDDINLVSEALKTMEPGSDAYKKTSERRNALHAKVAKLESILSANSCK